MLADPFCSLAAPGSYRHSIIASDLHSRHGPSRTACRQCKRSSGRPEERRITCDLLVCTSAQRHERPRVRAKQESRLAATVRIYCSELGSGATGIRTPDLLHAIHARPVARHGPRSPGGDLTCGNNRPMSPIRAWLLCTLAPMLAPRMTRNREGLLTNCPVLTGWGDPQSWPAPNSLT
jgi:hypothetical protein